jgi:hypothetical protein
MEEIEKQTRLMIIEIMRILYKNNITQVHMGGLLRILGVEEEVARESDNEYVELTGEFAKYICSTTSLEEIDPVNTTLH